ncbi:MAG: HlyD family secretion protein, partial [Mucilaginibacter sp.]|nr:HlyD family secretion protein [Mucilaginibacter sp.]
GTNADQVTNFTVKVRISPASYKNLLVKSAANPSPFRPGLTATVDINTNHTKSLSVPIQAVTTREQKKVTAKPSDQKDDANNNKPQITATEKEYVFVYKAGKVKQVLVTTGIQDDSYIQILSGLKSGDEVVSAPFATISKTLSDGMVVEKVDKSKLFSGDAK